MAHLAVVQAGRYDIAIGAASAHAVEGRSVRGPRAHCGRAFAQPASRFSFYSSDAPTRKSVGIGADFLDSWHITCQHQIVSRRTAAHTCSQTPGKMTVKSPWSILSRGPRHLWSSKSVYSRKFSNFVCQVPWCQFVKILMVSVEVFVDFVSVTWQAWPSPAQLYYQPGLA